MTACTYASPIGDLHLLAKAGRLMSLRFSLAQEPEPQDDRDTPSQESVRFQPVLDSARQQLDAYFARKRKRFALPIALQGTPFQLRVWAELGRIPFGQTISYRQLAERVGKPGASRAVGSANGANPLAIIVPCHRVIASDGTLAGFAGGVEIKRKLLDHEQAGAGLFAIAHG